MADAGLCLEHVRVVELPEFARRSIREPARFAIAPITLERALAQSRNPAASADDVGLLVAYLGERCVGYLGMIPAWLEEHGCRRKVFSLTTYFVGPEHRQTGAGALLLLRAISLGHELFVAGFSELAGRVYRAVGFRPVAPVPLLNLRIDAALVLPVLLGRFEHATGSRGLRWASRALAGVRRLSRSTVEAALRPVVIRLLLRSLRDRGDEPVFFPVESVRSPEGIRGAGPSGVGPRFVRDDATVNWMIHHPWITEDRSARLDYAFSQRRDLFRYLPFQVRAPGGGPDLGYVVLRVSADEGRTILKILDCVLVNERHRSGVLALALREALRWSADSIECGEEFALPGPSFLHRALTRRELRSCLLFGGDRQRPGGDRQGDLKAGVCDGDAPYV